MNVTYSAYKDAFAKAAEAKTKHGLRRRADRDADRHGRRHADERLHRRRADARDGRRHRPDRPTKDQPDDGSRGRHEHGRRRSAPARVGERLVPRADARPGIVLFSLHGGPDRVHGLAEPPQGTGHGPRARARAPRRGGLRRAGQLRRDDHRLRVLAQRGRVLVLRPRSCSRSMLGLALLFALMLDTPTGPAAAASPGSRSSCRTRCRRVIASLLWGFLYLPDGQPVLLRCSGARPAASPTCSAPGRVMFAIANIGVWGGVGFNMIVHLHGAAGGARPTSTRRPGSTAAPRCRSPCASRFRS